MNDADVKAIAPGSVVWVRCSDPVQLIHALAPEVRDYLSERFYVIFTTYDVEIDELDAQTLKVYGLRKIPKAVEPHGPNPGA